VPSCPVDGDDQNHVGVGDVGLYRECVAVLHYVLTPQQSSTTPTCSLRPLLHNLRGGYQNARFRLRQSVTPRSRDIRFLAFRRQKTNVKKRGSFTLPQADRVKRWSAKMPFRLRSVEPHVLFAFLGHSCQERRQHVMEGSALPKGRKGCLTPPRKSCLLECR
jgi:hypothetical protein